VLLMVGAQSAVIRTSMVPLAVESERDGAGLVVPAERDIGLAEKLTVERLARHQKG
jgi:hypothetical protein